MKQFNSIATGITLMAIACGASAAPRDQDGYNGRDYQAGRSNQRNDVAQVIRVDQIDNRSHSYQRQECWNEQNNNYDGGYYRNRSGQLYRGERRNNVGGAVVGGLVGGALGNQVGRGDGRDAATIAGVLIGAVVGSNVAKNGSNHEYQYRETSGTVRRCRTLGDYENDYNYPNGYNVTYRYANRTYNTVTQRDPGRSLRIVVHIEPRE